ncbi:MAG: alkaline phosphatase PafA [Cyclobacteriaceae bacterium]
MRIIILLVSVLGCSWCYGQGEKPKLFVGIVVDQMKMEYLNRFYDKFSEGGFKRLVEDGYLYQNAHYNYIPTKTGPGHASIYTGTTPSSHGIIANDWFVREKNLTMNCVSDLSVSSVGGSERNGKYSPKNLISSTITDELRSFSNFRSKVLSISIKNRGAILPGGHSPTGAFWMDTNTGDFMTSTYYGQQLPEWVNQFNKRKLVSKYLDGTWNTLQPIENYTESTSDDTVYERIFKAKERPIFPYVLSEVVKLEGVDLIRKTPFGNTLTLEMALASIEGEQMGQDQFTDFLAVSFSSTDYVGHAFGPNSIEIEDTYLRLDLELARLLKYLDNHFPSNYQVFLTSDHGVANVPQYQIDNKLPGGYINAENWEKNFEVKVNEVLGEGEWILDISNNQIFLDRTLLRQNRKNLAEVQQKVREVALSMDHVEQAYTSLEIEKRDGTDYYKVLLQNGFNSQRSGDILLKMSPGYLWDDYGRKGTTHQSGNTNDTHVPIIFYGANIPVGNSVRKVATIDIAPTISMLLNISLPSNATGQPLYEIFE